MMAMGSTRKMGLDDWGVSRTDVHHKELEAARTPEVTSETDSVKGVQCLWHLSLGSVICVGMRCS